MGPMARGGTLRLPGSPSLFDWRAAVVVLGFCAVTVAPVPPVAALLAGVGLAMTAGNPAPTHTRAWSQRLLTWSIVLLGAGVDVRTALGVGARGAVATVVTISATLALGRWLGQRLGVSRDGALLVSVGTAICGGSAIAAMAPSIDAKEEDVSLSLASIFLLNAVALLLFPLIGRRLQMPEETFGMWCALAIQDTSSVVGAAAQLGPTALAIATSAKLARALWIVPLSMGVAFTRRRSQAARTASAPRAPVKRPWFIAGFLLASTAVFVAPSLAPMGQRLAQLAHHLLAGTLFLVGLGLTRRAVQRAGPRPLVLAATLWIALATSTAALLLLLPA